MAQIFHAKDLRAGHTIILKNNIYIVLENSFNKTAMREGIVKCKVKNLRTNSITIEVLTGMKLEQAVIDKVNATFSYEENNDLVFMDMDTYDLTPISKKKLEWEKNFLTEGQLVSLLKYNNEILSIQLPDQIPIEIEYAEEAVQGNSVQSAQKKAKLVTGYELEVPQFIKSKERIIVNTINGTYVSREK